jgi:hypothetical protein
MDHALHGAIGHLDLGGLRKPAFQAEFRLH